YRPVTPGVAGSSPVHSANSATGAPSRAPPFAFRPGIIGPERLPARALSPTGPERLQSPFSADFGSFRMLQTIRNKAGRWFALAILFIALFSLTFFGIGDYFTTPVDTYVAKVEDREIDQARFRQEYQNWRENL